MEVLNFKQPCFANAEQPLEFVCCVNLAGKKDKELARGSKRNGDKNEVLFNIIGKYFFGYDTEFFYNWSILLDHHSYVTVGPIGNH